MAFVVTHRLTGPLMGSGRSMLRVGRLMVSKLNARTALTPQEAGQPLCLADADRGCHGVAGRPSVGRRGQPLVIR